MDLNPVKDFFVSYNQADRAWAEWMASKLEDEGYTCIIQAWDFLAGGNFVLDMHRAAMEAQRTIAVLSPDYLTALYTQPEWAAAFVQDPTGKNGTLLPVRVRECKPQGILAPIVYIDLVTLDESKACSTLLAGVKRTRAKPSGPLPFPGGASPTPKPLASFPGNWPEVWEVPYRRNPFFTGRDELLQQLHEKLTSNTTMALTQAQAISGLGGIGKTQTALEYAYRHQHEYRYVLWATADTTEGLSADYVRLAALLQVPGRDEKDQQITVKAFKRWLAHQRDWLLILDNADDVMMVREFLPDGPHMSGHIILTTRAQALGNIAEVIDVEKMGKEEGMVFLLRRARVNSNEASERATAEAIVAELEGFPLALDQAGAYIEETGCSLADYLKFYQTRRKELLKRRGRLVIDHREAVATTWDLSFKQIEQGNSAAVALLQLCAFLAPDAIQEELITEGADPLEEELALIANDEYRLNETIEVLRRYSLVRRNKDMKVLSMHRLVQVTLRDSMSRKTQQQWAKRAVYIVSSEFPFGAYQNWERCRRYLAQAQNCIELIKQYEIETLKAGDLAYNAAYYLYEQQKYKQAEEYYQQALHIYIKILGTNHHRIATIFHQLGRLSYNQGNYKDAKELAVKALHIYEKAPGSNNHRVAATFHQLALLSHSQKNYQEAENLYLQALSIYEKELGLDHSYTAFTLHQLGSLYYDQGDYKRAESFGLQALHIEQKMLGPDHPDTASTLHSLAVLYHNQKQYEKAETFYQQALNIREKALGLDHPRTINTVKSYASLLRQTNRNAEALLARIKPKPDRPSS